MANRIKSYQPLIGLLLNICLGAIFFGYNMGALNPCQDVIAQLNQWNDEDQRSFYIGSITSAMPLGALLGSYFTGLIMNFTQGVRKTLMLADIGGILSTFIQIYNSGFLFILIGRFSSGFIIGINTALIPVYIKEFSPLEISGKTGSLQELLMKTGIFISFVIGMILPTADDIDQNYQDQTTWRFVIGFAMIPLMIRFITLLCFYTFETPSILFKNQQLDQLKPFLESLYNSDEWQNVYTEYEEKFNLISMANQRIQENEGLNGEQKIYQKQDIIYSKKIQLAIILAFASQITGINVLMFYSSQIFVDSGLADYAKILNFIIGIMQIYATYLGGTFADKYGRRPLLLIGEIIIIIELLILCGSFYLKLPILEVQCIFVIIFGFSISLGPIPWLYFAEILNPEGVRLAGACLWFGTFATGIAFPIIVAQLNMIGAFFLFAILSILCGFYLFNNLVETKDIKLDQINKQFEILHKKKGMNEIELKQGLISL